MKKNYYALVAGMPDVAADDAKPALSVAVFKEEYLPRLSAKDQKLAELVLLKYDNRNLLAYLRQGEEADFDTRAVYPREAWSEAMAQVKADDEQGRTLPPFFYKFITAWPTLEDTAEGRFPEDILAEAYYNYVEKTGNAFMRDWFAFDRDVRNVLTALTARRYGFQPATRLIGGNEVAQALATSGSRDFGLGTELDWLDTLTRIYDTPDPVERERKLDLLKWDWLEEHTFFHYFSMERLLALLLKLDIVERWATIDPKRGGHVFRELVERLRNEAEIPQEFKK